MTSLIFSYSAQRFKAGLSEIYNMLYSYSQISYTIIFLCLSYPNVDFIWRVLITFLIDKSRFWVLV